MVVGVRHEDLPTPLARASDQQLSIRRLRRSNGF